MPSARIVDAHLHLWDPRHLRYPWLDGHALLERAYGLADYARATQSNPPAAMVFVQCEVEPAQALAEARWVSGLAAQDPRIEGIVAWAPLEKGRAARAELEALARLPLVRGIRRIVQFEPDPAFCLQPAFIEGVRLLEEFDWSFDICTDWSRMGNVVRFAREVAGVRLVLDHLGKPPVAAGHLEPWASQLRELAALPNVWCKISGLATEADHASWTRDALRRYLDVGLDAFGLERLLYGGDWPVCLQAIELTGWVSLLDEWLGPAAAHGLERFWGGNARHVYRLAA